MLTYKLIMVLANLVGLLVILACFFLFARVKLVKPLTCIPCIIDITLAIYKYSILITLASVGMVSAISLLNLSAYKGISLEIIYFTSILVLILFQICKKPEYPIANI